MSAGLNFEIAEDICFGVDDDAQFKYGNVAVFLCHATKIRGDRLEWMQLISDVFSRRMMDTRIIKIAITAALTALNVYLFATGSWGWGITMIFVVAIAVLLTIRSIRLIMVFFYMRQQKTEQSRAWLNRINPNHLWKGQRGYYYFMLGNAEIQTKSLGQSEKNFRLALSHGLRMDHDKAAVYLNLAVIAANKRKKREAINYINEAKRYDTKGYMKNDIKQLSKMVQSI